MAFDQHHVAGAQHLGQPLGPVAEREPPAILQQPERALADIVQRAVRLVAGSGPGPVGGLLPCREIGRVAGAQVVAACAFPEGAQVGADGRDVLNALFGAGSGQQRAGFGLQLQPQAGAAVAPVVPFQAHDAAAGAQVGGTPGPLWLRKPGQQQRV